MPSLLLDKPAGRLTDTTIIVSGLFSIIAHTILTRVQAILKQPEAWSVLPTEVQGRIYSKLPQVHDARTGEQSTVDTSIHPLRHEIYGEAIKDFIAYIEKMVDTGANKKAWLDMAREATIDRSRGAYDSSKDADREEYWGQKSLPAFDAHKADGTETETETRTEG